MYHKKSLVCHIDRLTVSVGEQLHQAIQTRVPHLANVGSAAADGLDRGSHKVFIHAFNVRLLEINIHLGQYYLKEAGESLLAEEQICTFLVLLL